MDAVEVRFRCSPVWETLAGFWALKHPRRHAVHQPWLRQVRPLLRRPDLAGHVAVIAPFMWNRGWLPDFLTPPPAGPGDLFEQELAALAATAPERVRDEIAAIHRLRPLHDGALAVAADPEAMLPRLVEAMRRWHDAAIAPYWPRIRALLEADIAARGQCLAESGLRGLFDSLHPTMRWDGDRIVTRDRWNLDLSVRGRGLTLMPSIFADRNVLWNVGDHVAPCAMYPVRAVATLWEGQLAASGSGLVRVVGPARARLLELARGPVTTSGLAQLTGLSAGAVSQHLSALHDAGLMQRRRDRRQVLYQLTTVGEALLDAGVTR
ncbi:ArsR/SmtB family transcription factor [Catellatospora tritici]|uniref:ArsR/SmtB family transcription factor n=1 Tax=Catellatospora tritici TaxID=2851566 RepID=UPI001C2DC26E|nr:DUF5937 family protein [Catellatospora tritici]MBV1853390.1 helix-turn-helix domain-containing protein [Catellatospora tritici]